MQLRGELEHARTELLWGHALAAYWDAQLGIRYDSGEGPNREWLAVGIQGLAPYWFELDATAYLGSSGRTALRLEAEYELLDSVFGSFDEYTLVDANHDDDCLGVVGECWHTVSVDLPFTPTPKASAAIPR